MNKSIIVLVLILVFTTLSCRSEPVIQQFPTPTLPVSARDISTNIDVMLYDDDKQPTMRVVGYATQPIPGGLEISILFEPQTQLMHDYQIWMHGWVDDPIILPPDRREYGYANFGNTRLEVRWIPTSYWVPNEPYIYTREIKAHPGEYTLHFGLLADGDIHLVRENGSFGIELGTYEIRANP